MNPTSAPLFKTALHAEHVKRGAKMTEFHGWDMPLYYQSILEEHACVRQSAGIFDISHMGQVLISGPGALETLNELVVSDIAKVGEERACYTMVLNEQGHILDDVIVYRVGTEEYLVIVNCANRSKDYQWLRSHQRGRAAIQDISAGRSIVAIQGPKSAGLLDAALETRVSSLGRFSVARLDRLGARAWVARTGYTGSDGFELFLEDPIAVKLWGRVLEQAPRLGVRPAGLGARDTLRLEAGLRLYGTDMDETATPYDADLGWTVALNKPSFIGKEALVRQRAQGLSRRLVGFVLNEGPVPRHGCELFTAGRRIGAVTSGTFSPMLTKPIGMGYVEAAAGQPGAGLEVGIRAKRYPATIVKMPFWRGERGNPGTAAVAMSA